MKRISVFLLAVLTTLSLAAADKKAAGSEEKKPGGLTSSSISGLKFRNIGPAMTSGRIGDIAVDPTDPYTWYIAVASGGVWKTTNAGTTFTPVFDSEASYSIGCVTVDPKNPLVVWVGTGENNSQRSVSYGDGVYKSTDGGKSWTNMGLKSSEHIGKILIDPRDSNVVWVAAQGPLWNPGGDRGLYKTTDGGKNWKKVLEISPNTGVSDIAFDPRNADVVYASAYQRRRHVWTLINGGPESSIHKTLDGGATWTKIAKGLPSVDLGRIGLAVAPSAPDTVYAIVEAANKEGGFYRSTDAGGSWQKQSDYVSGSPQYYQEIFVDPYDAERIYSMDVFTMVSEDAGKTFKRLGEKSKHVDNHALWIDPKDTDHLLIGCDGGLYQTWDRGQTYDFFENLPVTQFYRVEVDNSLPAYYVYGGTQDNFSLGGPSRTLNEHGIANSDWFVTAGGDGFQTRVDPQDPNIVYSESQHGGLVRYDRRSGEGLDVKPYPATGEDPLRWNWDSPLLISPHSHTRIYFAAQKLFRSDDRGNSWKAISGDLTKQIDRNKLKVMDRVWPMDAVAKNTSTSFYGNLVSLTESPKQENLIYTGSDDGQISVTEDAQNWTKIATFPGVPANTYVSDIEASNHDANVVYAAFDNHKQGDYQPYLLRSADKGKTWTSIAGDLPQRGTVYTVVEDPVSPNLLFAGTEFGAFFTIDGGKKWTQLKAGLPTIAVRDIAIQRRDNDLVLATFGRGFYILDDYTPLRTLDASLLAKEAVLFPVGKKTPMYVLQSPLGVRGKGFMGETYYVAPNPPFGTTFTYYLQNELKTLKKQRQESEAKLVKEGKDVFYPTWEALRAEERELAPSLMLTITDDEGNVVRRIPAPSKSGFQRVAWDLRYPSSEPVEVRSSSSPSEENIFASGPRGPMVTPGRYTATLSRITGADAVEGNTSTVSIKSQQIGEPQMFELVPLRLSSLPPANAEEVLAFQRKTARLQRAVLGAVRAAREAQGRIDLLEKALVDTPGAPEGALVELRRIELRLKDVQEKLVGGDVVARAQEPTGPSIVERVETVVEGQWQTTSAPTQTHVQGYTLAAAEFAPVLDQLQKVIADLQQVEQQADVAGAPWTPGRVPTWKPE